MTGRLGTGNDVSRSRDPSAARSTIAASSALAHYLRRPCCVPQYPAKRITCPLASARLRPALTAAAVPTRSYSSLTVSADSRQADRARSRTDKAGIRPVAPRTAPRDLCSAMPRSSPQSRPAPRTPAQSACPTPPRFEYEIRYSPTTSASPHSFCHRSRVRDSGLALTISG